jgi:hypothetical protein
LGGNIRVKTICVIILFFIIYLITVLGFQTFTITRYGLPLIPLALIFYAKFIYELSKESTILKLIFIIVIPIISIISIYYSLDPVSRRMWGTDNFAGQEIYPLNQFLAGNDGLVYNLQALRVAKIRNDTAYLANNNSSHLISPYCFWILPDLKNDDQIFRIFGLNGLTLECLPSEE